MILIQKVRVLNPVSDQEQVTDLLLVDGVIQGIAPTIANLPENIKVINGEGLIAGPGLVDLYSHSGEPGNEARETLLSLGGAAMAGGFTRLSILPDVIPILDNLALLESLQQNTKNLGSSAFPYFQFWGALTVANQGQQMTEMTELLPKVVGFSDGYPIDNFSLLRRILEYLQPFDKPIALVPDNRQLRGNGVMREGISSIRFGLPGNPVLAEAIAIASILELVAAIKTPVHLMRISTARGVELIAQAKDQGLPVTASTTWMHLLYDTQALSSYDVNLRLEPPLGNPSDVDALIKGVKTGVIDAIAVDHTPYTYEEKTLAFAEAPPGVIGLELILPVLWNRFVVNGNWSGLELWRALSTNPLLCLKQEPISCLSGQSSEIILFDPQQQWTVIRANLKSLSSNTPWWGKQITGRVLNPHTFNP
ncbi:dihydroorotase [Gloeocapsa sp. PCC 73106]|uniref:dihydroorotase n=1 Tax=Gloeocapsa sp. PCC 73106 TaxID=102232 RepID=UPI0002AC7FA8|nr:dihydroorotase [Gloeocapsa sp. PCC 73106]ELS00187.1 dihydroorotase-like cyclic amidohydrolase [Gloeocapsa sp. PCC 73106]